MHLIQGHQMLPITVLLCIVIPTMDSMMVRLVEALIATTLPTIIGITGITITHQSLPTLPTLTMVTRRAVTMITILRTMIMDAILIRTRRTIVTILIMCHPTRRILLE